MIECIELHVYRCTICGYEWYDDEEQEQELCPRCEIKLPDDAIEEFESLIN